MASAIELAQRWLTLDKDEETRAEIEQLLQQDDEAELERRLRTRIAFGTAGLRSTMKAGFAHMNSLTVLQASLGLAKYVLQQNPRQGAGRLSIVVGYDARYNSEKFARLAAAAFLTMGLSVLWFGELVHTPMVPFAVRQWGAKAGVMVTASHNPKNDNGYKVYWDNGSQIIPPHDAGIASAIDEVEEILTWDHTLVDSHANVTRIAAEATEAYLKSVRDLVGTFPAPDSILPSTYTAMHGVGLKIFKQVLHRLGIPERVVNIVEEQAQPDPNFPTVPFPNPEEKGALELATIVAERSGTTIILANDPDADRFSAAERLGPNNYHQFTGNQLGALLASYVLDMYVGDRSKMVMLASTVSSRMLAAMAKKEGFQFQETLTGFKWLGNVAQDREKEGMHPIFAFEEAIGYMFPSVVWDKDGIAAAAVFLSATQRWRDQGLTPYQKLQELYRRYGSFEDANTYLISPSPEITNRAFDDIRKLQAGHRPKTVGKRTILRWRDLTTGFDDGTEDHKPLLPVDPNAQMITCELDKVLFTVRGSGTEPKIKLYIEAQAHTSQEAKAEARDVLQDLLTEWLRPIYGLKLSGS